MFNVHGVSKLKKSFEADVLHNTLTLENFGINDLANVFPVWNIILTLVSILLFRIPKCIFHIDNPIDDTNFNDNLSRFYLDIVQTLCIYWLAVV